MKRFRKYARIPAVQRGSEAARLYRQGYSWPQVAATLGYEDAATAYQAARQGYWSQHGMPLPLRSGRPPAAPAPRSARPERSLRWGTLRLAVAQLAELRAAAQTDGQPIAACAAQAIARWLADREAAQPVPDGDVGTGAPTVRTHKTGGRGRVRGIVPHAPTTFGAKTP